MFLRRKVFAIFILLMSTAFMPFSIKEKWVVRKGGILRVDGSTNINHFSCTIKNYADPDTLTFFRNNNNLPVPVSGVLALPVWSFDCINKAMTSDLRKALKEKEFPNLSIHFLSLNKYPELRSTQEAINGIVNIELAGTSKKYEVNYRVSMDDNKTIHLVGKRSIRFSDFNLIPPRKLGGMVKSNDRLDIEFQLNFSIISE